MTNNKETFFNNGDRMTILDWEKEAIENIEGTVYISCIMEEVPFKHNTKRYQVYNEEGTYDEQFDITVGANGYIIDIE